MVSGLGFRVLGLGLQWGLGLRVYDRVHCLVSRSIVQSILDMTSVI